MVDDKDVRMIDPLRERAFQPSGLLPGNGAGMAGVEKHETQVIAEIQRGVSGFGIEAVEERVEKWRLGARLLVAALHFMVADAGDHWDQPAITGDHVFAVIAQER